MRWLMICFVVSLGALLVAAAGVARHIWRHRAQRRQTPHVEVAEEAELEIEP